MSSRSQILASRARPYDSEVEYIESTGTQWIDTGHVPTGDTAIEIDGYFTELVLSTYMGLSHSVPAEGKKCLMWVGISGTTGSGGSKYYSYAVGDRSSGSGPTAKPPPYNSYDRGFSLRRDRTASTGFLVVGASTDYFQRASLSNVEAPVTDLALTLFARRTCTTGTGGIPVIRNFTKFRMYCCRIIENGVVSHEYVPVRIGRVGALYDTVSGKVLFNEGTGAFEVGGDVSGMCVVDIGGNTGAVYNDDGVLTAQYGQQGQRFQETFSDLRSRCGGSIRSDGILLSGEGANAGDTISVYVEADGVKLPAQTLGPSSAWWPQGARRVRILKVVGTVASSSGGGGGCFVEGTLIRLADGSTKRVEDISPDDELLVWDGSGFSHARPSWIMDPFVADGWFLCRFASGRTLCTAGAPLDPGHRVFSLETGRYEYEKDAIGHRIRTVSVKGQPGEVPTLSESEDTLMSVERVMRPCRAYNIITEGSYNLFAEDALTSCRLSNPGMTEDEVSAYWDKLRKTGRVYG